MFVISVNLPSKVKSISLGVIFWESLKDNPLNLIWLIPAKGSGWSF